MFRRYNDKKPREPRKRMHYNRKGVEKQSFESEEMAINYIKDKRLRRYVPYLCPLCNHYHIGRKLESI